MHKLLISGYLIIRWLLISETGLLSAVAASHAQVALINNGGDAPPQVELQYFKAEDPRQLGSGDAVAYIAGSQEKLLRCNAIRIMLLDRPSAVRPEGVSTGQSETERLSEDRQKAGLHCAMWVRKLGTSVDRIDDLHTAINLLPSHDKTGMILTIALMNSGDANFHGSIEMVNVLPVGLEFASTVAVEHWTGLPSGASVRAPMPVARITPYPRSSLIRRAVPRNAIAFQEHVHGQALIYQAKAVSVPAGAAVAVDYIVRLSFR